MLETSNTLKDLVSLANELDNRRLTKEADTLDAFITKLAEDPEDSDAFGELIDLGEYRKRMEGSKPKSRERQDPEYLMENWQALQAAIDDLRKAKEELGPQDHYLIVLDDGETYAGEASIVKVNQSEWERIAEGEKIYDVVTPDHEASDAKWTDIWDIVKSEDL